LGLALSGLLQLGRGIRSRVHVPPSRFDKRQA